MPIPGTLSSMVISSIRMLVALHMILRLRRRILMDQEHHQQLHHSMLHLLHHYLAVVALDQPSRR